MRGCQHRGRRTGGYLHGRYRPVLAHSQDQLRTAHVLDIAYCALSSLYTTVPSTVHHKYTCVQLCDMPVLCLCAAVETTTGLDLFIG